MKATRFLTMMSVLLWFLCGLARAQVTTVRGEDEGGWKRTIKTDTKGRTQGVQA